MSTDTPLIESILLAASLPDAEIRLVWPTSARIPSPR